MRPAFHFTADEGWINDPHGITVRDDGYHVFFQYVPGRTSWAPNCHWGHGVGPDLLSLTTLPVSLAPGDRDDGIWTGSLVTDEEGESRIFYTSTTQPAIGIGRVRVATPTDEGWVGWAKGPVVVDAPEGFDLVAYRDPFVVRDPDAWRMFVGAGGVDGTAMALAYRSEDLETWTYEGVALERPTSERDPVWLGALWECPQVAEVDGVHVMVSSVWDDDVLHYAGYALGSYATGRFDAKTWGRLTHGPSYYAPSFFRDAGGRPCLLFWMRGVEDLEAGWASAHSVPYVLGVEGDRLVASPHPDVEGYRQAPVADGVVPGLAADVSWSPREDAPFVVSSGGETMLELRLVAGRLEARVGDEVWHLPYDGDGVRVILDAQVVEISCAAGLLGLVSVPAGDSLRIDGADVVHPLAR